jgi:putative Ca2+/H+ antiporter (TMEM165/GDT1 family)
MDWRLFITTFTTIFFAEMGDKTQFATISLAATGRSKWAVLTGASLALVFATTLEIFAGDALGRFVSRDWLRRIAGVLFLLMGALLLLGRNVAVASSP